MFLWWESWNQVKELMVEKIRAGSTFDEALRDVMLNNEVLYNTFAMNVRRDSDGFIKFVFGISTRR